LETFRKLLFLLTPDERKRAGLLLFAILIMALLDMIGVASILPFMAVLTNPGLVETNLILNIMFEASSVFGVENNQQFLFALGILAFVMLVSSLAFKVFLLDKGHLKDKGTFDELIRVNDEFRYSVKNT